LIFAVISFAFIAFNNTISSNNLSAAKTENVCFRTYNEGFGGEGYYYALIRECCTGETEGNKFITPPTCTRTLCINASGACAIIQSKGKVTTEGPNTDVLKNNGILEDNNTKAPNSDILKDNGVLENNNNNDNNTSDNNVKEPKAPKIPEDLGGLNDNGG